MKTKYSETGHQRRLTKLMRISAAFHYELKQRAQKRGITSSQMLDHAVNLSRIWLDDEDSVYFNKYPRQFDWEMVRKKSIHSVVMAKTLQIMDIIKSNVKKPEDYALHPNNLKPKEEEKPKEPIPNVNKI